MRNVIREMVVNVWVEIDSNRVQLELAGKIVNKENLNIKMFTRLLQLIIVVACWRS